MKFIQGEVKKVAINIISTKTDPFTIRNATYELINIDGGTEDSGTAEISGHEVSALVSPLKVSVYKLYFTYEIADEG